MSPDPELDLLKSRASVSGVRSPAKRVPWSAPAFSREVLDILGHSQLPQRVLYGDLISQHATHLLEMPHQTNSAPRLYINSNEPFSALVCGLQVRSNSLTLSLSTCSLTIYYLQGFR